MIQARDVAAALFGVFVGFALMALSKSNTGGALFGAFLALVFAYGWYAEAKKNKATVSRQ